MSNTVKQVKEGYTGLVWSDSFVSKAIQLWMKVWYKIVYQKDPPKNVPSHVFKIITIPDDLGLYVCEAGVKGVQIVPFESSGYMNNLNVSYREPIIPYTRKQMNSISKLGRKFCNEITRYDFPNFIYQMDMIARKLIHGNTEWHGPVGLKSQKRLYCSELGAYLDNAGQLNTWEKPWAVNPVDHMFNSRFKDVI